MEPISGLGVAFLFENVFLSVRHEKWIELNWTVFRCVPDLWHFDRDPDADQDSRIRTFD